MKEILSEIFESVELNLITGDIIFKLLKHTGYVKLNPDELKQLINELLSIIEGNNL